jgi:DNA-binding transcriptional MerR regulator
MNTDTFISASMAVELYQPEAETLYSIERAEQLTHIPRRRIALYYRYGLVSPVHDPEMGGWFFNDEGLLTLRRVDHLHRVCGMNPSAIRLLLGLMQEVEELRRELRFWRGY